MSADTTKKYDKEFYLKQKHGSLRSALHVLPVLFDLVKPKSIVDFGCGVGTWLAASKQLGIEHCLGIEGSWVRDQISDNKDIELLETDLEQRIFLDRRFDLAMCLEVAEHLSPGRANSFVSDLCAASDMILFSAAAPGNDGDGHQNEQWPSYWAQRFIREGYIPLDIIRPAIVNYEEVEYWYRTGIILYVRIERVRDVLINVKLPNLENLDLPRKIEIVGLKEAKAHFSFVVKRIIYWSTRRFFDKFNKYAGRG